MSTAWTNQVTSLIILTEQTTGFSGLFGYSPSAGAGNLVLSIAAVNGTDPYGNAYSAGVTSYNGGMSANLTSGGIAFFQSPTQLAAAVIEATPGEGFLALTSGQVSGGDTQAVVSVISADANSGQSAVTINAADFQVNNNATISGSLTVSGTDLGALVASIVSALSGQVTTTNGLADGTISGTSDTDGLPNGGINGTSGGASAGTAHTHSAGSYAVISGQHTHGNGSYAVTNGTHDHTLPTV